MICQVSIVFQRQNNELIVLYNLCDTVHLQKCAAVETGAPTHDNTHMQTCTVYCYVKMFCVAMIEEKKKSTLINV